MTYNVLPKDTWESENYYKFRNNAKHYFYDMDLAGCMATGLK